MNTKPTQFLDQSKLIFVVLYNSEITSDKKYEWLITGNKERILNGQEWICHLFRKAYTI